MMAKSLYEALAFSKRVIATQPFHFTRAKRRQQMVNSMQSISFSERNFCWAPLSKKETVR